VESCLLGTLAKPDLNVDAALVDAQGMFATEELPESTSLN